MGSKKLKKMKSFIAQDGLYTWNNILSKFIGLKLFTKADQDKKNYQWKIRKADPMLTVLKTTIILN